MLPLTRIGAGSPALVLLHFFAGSQRGWAEVSLSLSNQFECITMDLPGFGEAASIRGYSMEEMTQQFSETLDSLKLSNFVLVGHSMSGKVALALAASGRPELAAVVLVAPSPPSPEPIEEKNREKMLGLQRNRKDAETYLDGITAHPLTGSVRDRAAEDFIRTSPDAWNAWLEGGSKEDWSGRVGTIDCPALIITGDQDPSLAAPVQKKLTLPHLVNGRIEVIAHCGHLPMMEKPEALSALIAQFILELSSRGRKLADESSKWLRTP